MLEDARPLRFAHAIVRDAVAARLSAGVRSALHARAAEPPSARGASPDAVAGHLLATEPRGRRWVVEQLADAAGRALARGAPDEAAVRLRRALAEPPPSGEQLTLVLQLARAESLLGRPDAVALYERVHDEAADDELRARALIELVWARGPKVDRQVIERLERCLAEAGENQPLALELEAARLSAVQILWVRPQWAARTRERWSDLRGRTVEERLLLAQLAIGQMSVGGPARLCADFAGRAIGHTGFEAVAGGELSLMLATIALLKADELDAAERVLGRELRIARDRGALSSYAVVCNFRAAVALRRGDLDGAEAEAGRGSTRCPATPGSARSSQVPWCTPWPKAASSTQRRRCSPRTAGTTISPTPGLPRCCSPAARGYAAHKATTVARYPTRSRPGDAFPATPRAWTPTGTAGRGPHRFAARKATWTAHARTPHNFLPSPGDGTRRGRSDRRSRPRHRSRPAALGCRSSHRPSSSSSALPLAFSSPKRSSTRAPHCDAPAGARRRASRCAAGSTSPPQAAPTRWPTARARSSTQPGLRVRRDAQTGIAALTPSERRIAEHAAAGATNPQIAQALFVTVKTVEMHLGHVYRKLDISSRHQIADKLAGEAPGEPGAASDR